MTLTPTQPSSTWAEQASHVTALINPLGQLLRLPPWLQQMAESRAQALAQHPPRAAAAGNLGDFLELNGLRGAAYATRPAVFVATGLAALYLPKGRSSWLACAIPIGCVGSGAKLHGPAEGWRAHRLGRAAEGMLRFGALGAIVGLLARAPAPAAGASTPAATPAPAEVRASLAGKVADAALALGVVTVCVVQWVACVYPILLVAAMVLGAAVAGALLGATWGGLLALADCFARGDAFTPATQHPWTLGGAVLEGSRP